MKLLAAILVLCLFLLFAGCTTEEKPECADNGLVYGYACNYEGCYYSNLTSNPVTQPTPTPTPSPTPSPYVMCSDYLQVTDRYKTVNGLYITAENETYRISNTVYENVSVGGFIKTNQACPIDAEHYCYYSSYFNMNVEAGPNMVPVSEEESGYRYACKVLP